MKASRGFSLIEIAIGLMIIGLVAAGLIASINQQNEQRRLVDTRSTLAQSREAVMAFVSAQGRLPCPATALSNGQEAIANNAGGVITCTAEVGFLPAVTLGISGVEANGLLNSAWIGGSNAVGNWPRAIRYAVTALAAPVTSAFTSPGLGAPASTTRRADIQTAITNGQALFVCASATGINTGANRCGAPANLLSGNAAAVIWSLGANGADVAAYSADETQNANVAVPRVLISRNLAPQGATGGMFDDLVTWIPASLVMDRLLASGAVQ